MSLPIWPDSPIPAGVSRQFNWSESAAKFDSGLKQAMTPWSKPMYAYEIPYSNINVLKQQVIADFTNSLKGQVLPFLFMDPYEYQVFSVEVGNGLSGSNITVLFFDTRSYRVIPSSLTVGSLSSTLSGTLVLGFDYLYDQDTGTLAGTKGVGDTWGVTSMEYYRKCRLTAPYQDQGVIWQQFQANIKFEEEPSGIKTDWKF